MGTKDVPHYTVLECDRVLQNNVVRVEHEIIEKMQFSGHFLLCHEANSM